MPKYFLHEKILINNVILLTLRNLKMKKTSYLSYGQQKNNIDYYGRLGIG